MLAGLAKMALLAIDEDENEFSQNANTLDTYNMLVPTDF